jgi:hypothetical protein
MSGQYGDPLRVVAFNTAEHWSEDASEDVAREILRRLDLAGDELPSSIQAFVESHLNLKGARASDLPVKQPDRYAMSVNLLGLRLPASLIAAAEEFIE